MSEDYRNSRDDRDSHDSRDSRGSRDSGPRGRYSRGRPGGFRRMRRKVCSFCVEKVKDIDYKDIPRLRRLVTDRGKILKSRATGTCVKHQRAATRAIKRARHIALLPFVHTE